MSFLIEALRLAFDNVAPAANQGYGVLRRVPQVGHPLFFAAEIVSPGSIQSQMGPVRSRKKVS